jgi:protein phosphatase PTC1
MCVHWLDGCVARRFVINTPYYTRTVLTPEHKLLVLACDGVFDVCSDDNAFDIVRSESGGALAQATKLVDMSMMKGSRDNLSACVVHL